MPERICEECGQALGENDAVCPNCGAPAGTVCSECGRVIPPGKSICPNCGAPAGQVQTAPLPRSGAPAEKTSQPGSALAVCALVFAFFFPPAGLVLAIAGLVTVKGKGRRTCAAALVISVILLTAIAVFLAKYLPRLIDMLSTGQTISDFFHSFFN